MKRLSALALVALALANAAVGCNSDEEASSSTPSLKSPKIKQKKATPASFKLKPNVVQVGQVVANKVKVLPGQLVLAEGEAGAAVLQGARQGEVLVGPPNQRPAGQKAAGVGEPNPLGFARKVKGVTRAGGQIVIETSDAILVDVFEELSVTMGDPNLMAKLALGDAFDANAGPDIQRLKPGLEFQDDSGKSCAQVASERGWPAGAYTCDDGTHGWCNGNDPTQTADCAQCCSPSCGDIGAKLGKTASDPPLLCDNGNGVCNGTGVATWDCANGCCGPGLTAGETSTANGLSDIPVTMSGPQGIVDFVIGNTLPEVPASGSLLVSPSFTFSPGIFFLVYINGGVMHNLVFVLEGQASAGLKINGQIDADPKGIAEFFKKNEGEADKQVPPQQQDKGKHQVLTMVLPLGLPVPVVLDVKVGPKASWATAVSGSVDLEGAKTWSFRKGILYDSGTPNSSECGNWPGSTCPQPEVCAEWQQLYGSAPACDRCTMFNHGDPCQPGPWFTLDRFSETDWTWIKQSVSLTGKVSVTVGLEWDIGLMLGGVVGPFVELGAPEVTSTLSLEVGAVSADGGDQGAASACYWNGAIDVDVGYSVAVGCRAQVPFLGSIDSPTYPLGSGSAKVFHAPLELPAGVCLACFPAISDHACTTGNDCCTGNCVGPVNNRTCACSNDGGACQLDSDCCPQPGKPVACDGGVCTSSCATKCTPGETQCNTPGEYRQCEAGPGGCTVWKNYPCKTSTACFSNKAECANGPACQSTCTLGETQCNTPGEYRQCEAGPGGCTVWNSHPCKTSTACFSNKEECVNGAQPCNCANGKHQDGTPIDPAATYCGMKVCGMDGKEYSCGSDNQWGPTGTACGPTCQNQCNLGDAAACTTPSQYRKCEVGSNGCNVWNQYNCKTSTACYNSLNTCMNGCATNCTLGETQCNHPGQYSKCESDPSTGCDTWKNYDCKIASSCYSDFKGCSTGVACKAKYVNCSATSQCCSGLTCKKDADNTLACLP